jgi:hypothetical protein
LIGRSSPKEKLIQTHFIRPSQIKCTATRSELPEAVEEQVGFLGPGGLAGFRGNSKVTKEYNQKLALEWHEAILLKGKVCLIYQNGHRIAHIDPTNTF